MTTTTPEPAPQPGLLRRTVRKHWAGLLGVWFLGSLALAAAVSIYVRTSYKAYSIVRVVPAANALYGVRTNGENFEPFLQTLVNLVTSPNVLTAAGSERVASSLPRIRAAGDIVQELRKVISVGVIPGTYLIEVSMTSPDSYEAAVLVNAVVEAFIKSNDEFTDGMSKTQIRSLEAYLSDLKNQTDELEIRWKELVSRGDIDSQIVNQFQKRPEKREPAEGREPVVTVEQLKRLSDEMFNIHLELIQAEAWSAALRADLKQAGPEVDQAKIDQVVDRRFKADPEVAQLGAELMAARSKLADAQRIQRQPDDPAVIAARRKLDALQGHYQELWASKSKGFRTEVETTSAVSDQELREAEAHVRSLRVKQAALKAESEKMNVKHHGQATDQVDIKLLQEKRAILQGMQEAVNRRLEQLKFEARGETRITQMNKAMPSNRPVPDKRLLLMMITPFPMIFVAFGLFLGFEACFGSQVRFVEDDPLDEV